MTISYNSDIPAASHNPSTDQPNMLTNTNAINQIIGVDHISFNAIANDVSGTHKFVTFNDNTTPVAPTLTKSVLYTTPGTANPAANQLLWQNAGATFPVSLIRAYFTFQATASPTFISQYNCASITQTGGFYFITFVANTVSGTSAGVVFGSTLGVSYNFSSPGVLRIGVAGGLISGLVLQI